MTCYYHVASYQCYTITPDLLYPGLDEEPKSKLYPQPGNVEEARIRVRTSAPDGVVDLTIGESGMEAEKPINVGQLFKSTVERHPRHPALSYKENGTWIAVSYSEYYSRCIKAAKSFLKVRVETAHVCYTVGFGAIEIFPFWSFWLVNTLTQKFSDTKVVCI